MPHKDSEKARAHDRERYRQLTAERLARGLCPKCGKAPPTPDRRLCVGCGENRRKAERDRYAKGKAEGRLYGGRDVEDRRRIARTTTGRRYRARLAVGLCPRCGKRPPVEGRTACDPCRDARQAGERERWAGRRTAGLCGTCGKPAFDGASRCGRCAALEVDRQPSKNAASRRRYTRRRAGGGGSGLR